MRVCDWKKQSHIINCGCAPDSSLRMHCCMYTKSILKWLPKKKVKKQNRHMDFQSHFYCRCHTKTLWFKAALITISFKWAMDWKTMRNVQGADHKLPSLQLHRALNHLSANCFGFVGVTLVFWFTLTDFTGFFLYAKQIFSNKALKSHSAPTCPVPNTHIKYWATCGK